MNTISVILEPIIAKSMQVRGYIRAEATQKAEKWLAGELRLKNLEFLDFCQLWEAEAIVEKAMLPKTKNYKKKVDVLKSAIPSTSSAPLGEWYWEDLKKLWGEEYFNWFFNEEGVESTALLSPGQQPQREWSKSELILVG